MKRTALACLILALTCVPAAAQPAETEIPGVTAELLELRQDAGVLALAVKFVNTTASDAAVSEGLMFKDVTLIDAKAKTKYLPLEGPGKRFFAGPASDHNEGGRWFIHLPPKGDAVLWLLFDPIARGAVVSVQVPRMFPFENVTVVEGAPSRVFSSTSASSTPSGLMAKLVSAVRLKTGEIRVRLRVERTGVFEPKAFVYGEFMLLDPVGRKVYGPIKADDGLYVAQPRTDNGDGGRFWPNGIKAGAPALMSVTFGGVPRELKTIDLLMPWFLPMRGIQIVDEPATGVTSGSL